jgi:outer membrane biosynthesis protein TonB
MKIEFEGKTLSDILDEMESMLLNVLKNKKSSESVSEKPNRTASAPAAKAQGPGPEELFAETPVDISGDKPVEKPVKPVKPVHPNIAKMQAAKAAKKAEREKAAAQPAMKQPPPPKTAEGMDPAEVVKLRTKTIEDLQQAYANGHQQEVFELLSRFGNGAKSFRELPADAFVPIREAIDNGALT